MSKMDVYVDGSYREGAKEVAGAAIFIIDGKVISCMRFKTTDESLLKHRQVSGEVVPTLYALEFVDRVLDGDNNLDVISICYDYTGVKDWLDGTWKKANNDMSRDYMARGRMTILNLANKGITVRFQKIKSHTGDKYNEYADRLANGIIPQELSEDYNGEKKYYLNGVRKLTVED